MLSSGKKSRYFIDCKDALLTSIGHNAAGNIIISMLGDLEYKTGSHTQGVAGVPIGGYALASAVATISGGWSGRQPFDALYIRKEAKDHGTKRRVEGSLLGTNGTDVCLLEDVITTGGSVMNSLEILKDEKYNPVSVISIVDRGEGGKEAIEDKYGIPVFSAFTLADILAAK